jgi:NAD(P)-dependent dehydrogenase (short-subunit alcohol dehydrogenase family)
VIEKVVQDSPIGRIGQPSEIAATVLWLCDEGAGFLTGQAIAVDGGMTAR